MIDVRSCLAVLVAYRSWPWTAVAVGSFQQWFPDLPLLIIDNNPTDAEPAMLRACDREMRWLEQRSNLEIIPNPGRERGHGIGLDVALRHCRRLGVEYLVHVEPDCLISGRGWFEALSAPFGSQYDSGRPWMSGMMRHFYGPIHPTPSMWRVDVPWGTFNHLPRAQDIEHARFADVFDLPGLQEWVGKNEPHAADFWARCWDTAQRNWFLAAAEDRATLVEPTADFQHFWIGSQRGPDPHDARLAPYLSGLA